MRLNFVISVCLLCLLSAITAYSQVRTTNTNIPGKLVFKLKPQFRSLIIQNTANNYELLEALTDIGTNTLSSKFPKHTASLNSDNPEAVDISLIYEVNFKQTLPFEKVKRDLLGTGFFEYVEPLRNYSLLYEPNDLRADSNLTASSYQYHLKNSRTYRGWDFGKGDSSIVIGIIDTGLRNHEDLESNIKLNYNDPIDGIDNDGDGYVDNFRGWDLADNDYNVNASDGHGTFVAGVSSAKLDNGKGVAGVGFNCKFLPIKAYATTAAGAFAGYEAIIYAADHGCSVVNLSWGDPVAPSMYEQDLINYAVINKNVVVVAAAGNTNGKLDFYPASYNNVLSVGWLNKSNLKAATYSYKIDLSANGTSIWTTGFGTAATYTSNVSGSSFASPQVAGAAGLVRHNFPHYTAQQVAEQLRVTANSNIYNLSSNISFKYMLGKGILDVASALTANDAKSVRYTALNLNKNGLFYPGDTINMAAVFKNYLSPVSNLSVTVSSNSPYVTILQPTFQAGSLGTLASATTNLPFKIKLAANLPTAQKIAFRFDFSDGTYTDYQYYELFVNPDYLTLDVNQVAVTINSVGNFGFNGQNAEQGVGFRYKQLNLLSEGGLMVGTSGAMVSDNIRNATPTQVSDNNFTSQNNILLNPSSPFAAAEVYGSFTDKYPNAGMAGVSVSYKAYAFNQAPSDKFAILEYVIKNAGSDSLKNLYAGLFADWDIIKSSKNRALWDAANNLGYVYNIRYDTIYAGIKLLTPGQANYYALNLSSPPAGTLNISDGFSDSEKYTSLSNGTANQSAGNAYFGSDVAQTISATLPMLAPGQEITIAFALIAGDNLKDLQNNAQIAQDNYDDTFKDGTATPLPVSLMNFSAKKGEANTAMLKWQTASETNNEKFVIERSANGKSFTAIGTVVGAGDSHTTLSYSFYDRAPTGGLNYYRLRQQDFNGTLHYSEIKTVSFSEKNNFTVSAYPNPFKEHFTIQISLPESRTLEIQLFDGLGRLVAVPLARTKLSAGHHNVLFKADQNLPAGVYTYKLSGENFLDTGKIVLVK